jgi:hypothetical protein
VKGWTKRCSAIPNSLLSAAAQRPQRREGPGGFPLRVAAQQPSALVEIFDPSAVALRPNAKAGQSASLPISLANSALTLQRRTSARERCALGDAAGDRDLRLRTSPMPSSPPLSWETTDEQNHR